MLIVESKLFGGESGKVRRVKGKEERREETKSAVNSVIKRRK